MWRYSVSGLKYRGFPYVLYILLRVQTVSHSRLFQEDGKATILFFLERFFRVTALVNNQRQLHNIMNKASQYQQRAISEAYSIIESHLLGRGSTGDVYLGLQRNHLRRQVAIKSIDLKTIDNEVTRYLLSCEIAALSNLGKLQNTGHENIVRLYDIVLQDHHIYLVMEHLQGGTLSDYLKKHPNGLPDSEVMQIFRQILQGYLHMKRKDIVHRDLKPDNILFKKDPQICKTVAIIDFGYCQMQEVPNKPQVFYNVGSPKYMAPEAYKQNNYSQKSDIWALGVILYEMVFGRTCDRGLNMDEYLHIIERQGIPFPVQANPFHRHILNLMLRYSHQNRSTGEEILREIDALSSNLNHQRSQIILSRKSIDQGMMRNSLDPFQIRPSKQSQIFQSLILPTNNSSFHHPSQSNINGFNQQRVVMQRRSVRVPEAIPAPQNFARNGQIIHEMNPKPQCLVQNMNIQSVRDIIQRRQYEQSHLGSQMAQKQVNGSSFASTTNSNQFTQFSQQASQHRIHSIQGNNFPENIQNRMNTEPRQINFAHPKVRFITNFQAPTHHGQPNFQPSFPVNQPRDNVFNNFPENRDINKLIIQQEAKIEVFPAKNYQKVHIFSTTSPKFWQKNEKLLKTEESNAPSQPRPAINLRPSTNQVENRVGFIKLQPQRILKHPVHPTLLRQGFCA